MKLSIILKAQLLIIFVFMAQAVFSQYTVSSWRQIESNPDMLKIMQSAYEQFYKQNSPDTLHPEKKAYGRYLSYWEPRFGVTETGEISYEPYLQAALSNASNPICVGNDPADWQLMGPYYHPEKQQQGLFTEVLYDEDFPKKLLISSNHGGIWKFNPDINEWYSVTDDIRFPGLSANDFLRHPFDSDVVFAATGNGLWKTDYGVGLLVSNDRGETWHILQSFMNHIENELTHLVRVIADPRDTDPSDGLTIYVASSEQVYIANYTESVQNWQTLSSPNLPDGEEIIDLQILPSGDLIIGTEFKWSYNAHAYVLHESEWEEILIEENIKPQRVRFSDPIENTIFALKDNEQILNGDKTYFRSIYKSTDGGVNWNLIRENIEGPQPKAEIEYSNEDILYISGKTGLYILDATTGNMLKYFNDNYYTLHADIRDIYIANKNNGIEEVYLANDGGITKLNTKIDDLGSSTLENLNGDYLPCNNVVGLAVSNATNKSWFTSAIHQGTWSFADKKLITQVRGDGEDGAYNPDNDKVYYINNWGTIKRHNENGAVVVHDGLGTGSGYQNGTYEGMRMEISQNNSDVLYFGLEGQLGIYNDATEQTIYSETVANTGAIVNKVGPIAISKNDKIFIADYKRKYPGDPAKFMVSNDNGISWIDKSFKTVYKNVNGQWQNYGNLSDLLYWKSIFAIATNPDDDNELWIGIGGVGQEGSMRVLRSTDGGESWYDYSEGLTAMPITDFLYHWETETLFVGTDVGVFYRQPFNDQNDSWACFSNGLPVAAITEMDYNACSNELFISMQGRSVFATPIPFDIINSNDEDLEGDEIIYGAVTWNSPHYFDGDVTIAPNASLTINADCSFSADNRIIVLPSGSLTVNATLGGLNCSSGAWQGIQVVGNSNQPPQPTYQGIVYAGENAVIQEAKIAIATYQFDALGNEIEESYGGIIKANGATFINNGIACEIKHYINPNPNQYRQQEIKNCEFYTDGAYYGLFSPYTQTPIGIQIINNSRIKIENNNFTTPDGLILGYWSDFPIGIQKFNSSAEIKNNIFERQSYGIYSRDYFPVTGVDIISNNTFKINYYGLYENGVAGSQVYHNSFNNNITYQLPYNNEMEYMIGVYKDACSNYLLEENDFDGNHAQHFQTNIGILINNGGGNDQIIYKNEFSGYDYAILAQGNNRSIDGTSGLSFKCNEFIMEKNDISVSIRKGTTGQGIATAQGSAATGAESAAGNFFNDLSSTGFLESQFWNLSNLNASVTYHHHNVSLEFLKKRIIPGYIDPSLINGVVVTLNSESVWDGSSTGSCPSNLPDDWEVKKGKLQDAGGELDIYKQSLSLLVDDGNTNQLNIEVNTSESTEAYSLRNELLNSSPYLSNEVLKTATNKEQVLTNPLIRDVLVANPQAAKNEEVLDLLAMRSNPMPDYMKNQIINGQALISAKEQMESKIHQQQLAYSKALSQLTAQCLTDTTGTYTFDTLTQLLVTAKNIAARYQLAGIYYDMGDFAAMNNTLNAINASFNLNDTQFQELNELADYYELLEALKTEERSPYELTGAEISTLTNLYENSDNKAAVYARNLLLLSGNIAYDAPVILPDMGLKSSLIDWQATSQEADRPEVQLSIYPNPAREYIVLDYDITGEYQKASIQIYQSVKGDLIKQQEIFDNQNAIILDIADLISGVYLATIQIDGRVTETVKFTISH